MWIYQRSRASTISLDNCIDENGGIALIDLLADESSDVAGQVEQREFFRRLGQAIDRLEAKQRAVFLATEFNGMSFKQLALEWNEPVGTLLSRKSRAVKALREMLKDYSSVHWIAKKPNEINNIQPVHDIMNARKTGQNP